MPLSEQEIRCIEYACEFLSSSLGGRWSIESYLDETHPTEPTPEVVITNGEMTAAIEVKEMAGGSVQQEYRESLYSNERYLSPPCGGYYLLIPPVDLRLRMNSTLREQVKSEIARVAPTLKPNDKGVLLIPRSGHIALISRNNPPWIHCSHGLVGYSDLFRPLLDRLEGRFMLVDEGLEHSFFTDEGREAFYDAVVKACRRRLEGDASDFSWNEEWQIVRCEESKEGDREKDGVWILTSTDAVSVPHSIAENLQDILDNALRKFVERWANLHILVLEENVSTHTKLIRETVAGLSPAELPNVDYVLLVSSGNVIQCYPRPS